MTDQLPKYIPGLEETENQSHDRAWIIEGISRSQTMTRLAATAPPASEKFGFPTESMTWDTGHNKIENID